MKNNQNGLACVKDLLASRLAGLDPEVAVLLTQAIEFAEIEHDGQFRKSHDDTPDHQDPYLIHPLRTALILLDELNITDTTALAAAILHDVVEDGNSKPTIGDIAVKFGDQIAAAVNSLSKTEKNTRVLQGSLQQYYVDLEKAPLHVRLVKLADRLDNARECLMVLDPRFQFRYFRETRKLYLPLAKKTSSYFERQLAELCDQLESNLPMFIE